MVADFATTIERFVEKLKPLPWGWYAIVVASSFVIASFTSTFIGIIYMPNEKNRASTTSVTSSEASDVKISGVTLDKTAMDRILARNIFNSDGEKGDVGSKKGPKSNTEEAVKSDLPVKLIGVIYGGDPFSGIAIVENTAKRSTNSFMVTDQVDRDATVKEIHQDRIVVENQGRKEFVMIETTAIRRSSRSRGKSKSATADSSANADRPMASGAPPESYKEEGFSREKGEIEMTEAFKGKLLGPDMATVLQDAKADPNVVDNELRGFKLTRIRSGSIYEKTGFMNGDVIEEINGVMLTDTGQAIKMLQSVRNEKEIEVRYSRNGAKYTATLRVR